MNVLSETPKVLILVATLAVSAPGVVQAQQAAPASDLEAKMAASPAPRGPDIKGIIAARHGDTIQVMVADGTRKTIAINDSTRVAAKTGLLGLGRKPLATASLLNGLPVSVKTVQVGDALLASQINFGNGDFKTATMIRNGTAQGFDEQTAATEALRGRMADIDQYNIKATTYVNFATGRAELSAQAKAELCASAASAEAMKNALMLVVGYTDSTGSQEFNQQLSEKRASRVVNYIQQACGWKPYRMLTPTGMAEADPLADNESAQGKAQNRRVAVNILVSKGLDGL